VGTPDLGADCNDSLYGIVQRKYGTNISYLPTRRKFPSLIRGDIIFYISRRGENFHLSMGRYNFMPKGTIYIHADVHHMLHIPTRIKCSSLNGEILFSSQWAHIYFTEIIFRPKGPNEPESVAFLACEGFSHRVFPI
jgi:hypothetical protein